MNVFKIFNRFNTRKCSNKRKKNKNRMISIAVSAAIIVNSIPMTGLSERFSIPQLINFSEPISASAYSPVRTEFSGNTFDFNNSNINDFIDYCYLYQNDTTFASDHKGDTLRFSNAIDLSQSNEALAAEAEYLGLGTSDSPFEGTITFASTGSYDVVVDRAFFRYLSDKAQILSQYDNSIITLAVARNTSVGTGESKPVLADYVVDGGGSGNWSVEIKGSGTFSGAIGEIGEDANVDLEFKNTAGTNVVFNGTDIADAGTICGKMRENSELKLTYIGSFTNVTSEHGSAGGLIGEMGERAALRLSSLPAPYAPTVNAKDGYAGGIVGYMAESAVITNNAATPAAVNITVGAVNVKGKVAAGGLYGHYVYSSDQTIDLNHTTINVSDTRVGGAGFCGTLYGVLETSGNLTITSDNTAISCSSMNSGDGCFGGVIGKLVTSSLSQTISIQNLKISPTGSTAFSSFGGVIGCVDSAENTSTYVNVNNVEVSATVNSGTTSFGGVIGDTSVSNGVFVDLGNFKLTTTSGVKGGGIVGTFNNGVLRLSGTTDLSGATITSAENCGQLVGYNNNVLVYALGNGSAAASPTAFSNSANNWRYLRPNGATVDDLGTWGEVVRIVNGSNNLEQAGIITVNSNHSVTLAAPVKSNISNTTDFAKTALNMMLNRGNSYGGLFTFAGSSPLSSNLTIKSDITEIDLAGTGLIGFMRDGSDNMSTFSGSLNGNSKVIKLAVGEAYGLKSNGDPVASTDEGAGQIYRHKNIGLFSSIGNGTTAGTVSNLKVAGTMDIHNKSADMNIGGISAKNSGNVTLTGVTVGDSTNTLTINYNEASSLDGTATTGVNIGGLVGLVDTNGTINVTGGASSVGAKLKMTGAKGNGTSYGGAVGKVTASSFTINIGDTTYALTIGMDADVSGLSSVGENSNCGGLIGNITDAGSYGARTVNINKLDFNDCKIGNAATANGGGMLGYSWLNTTANISGMTITSATINNSAANVGAMCYEATGKWGVDSLTVTSLSMPSGGGTSFGMLVNKAYTEGTANTDGTTNYTGGLYLDVLASGYDPTGATIPSTAKYDEIAAYSAKAPADILTGGAGVISINMNSARTGTDATVTTNGTYTNQLTGKSGVVNDTSRYYYNLDVMSSSDQAQNLLLWSVNRYAHSDISGEFVSSLSTMLSGTADMTGLSFYPVALADGLTIDDLTLTLDYAGIYDKTGSTMDPAGANQHYLMHSGLFLNSSAGSTLTISGELTLSGNFLETGEYKGVLISNTMRGSLICTNGSIELAGITPSDSDGYLLINNIKRQNEQAIVPALNLYNVKTTDYTGTILTKSLIGPAEGTGLQMEFKWIKLDSIFSQASLLDSIKTDDKSLLKYTFTYDDDWGDSDKDDNPDHNVTYGKEISESVQYSGQEQKYLAVSGQYDYYVNPSNDPSVAANNTARSFTGYKPYVRQPYVSDYTPDENGLYYFELKVNVQLAGLAVGCGTYNDPYQIANADQLQSVALFLKNGNQSDLVKVRLPKKIPTNLNSGDRWCENKSDHADYTYNTTKDKFTSSESGVTAEWTKAEIQQYLAAAYYQIKDNIVLASDFPGLGGATANTAFRGVIVGDTNNDGTPKYSITNPSHNSFINVSNGSVIKDITINVRQNITREQDNVYDETASKYFTFGYGETDTGSRQAVFYGGIIGEIMGGDNIIDNSYVNFTNSSVTLSGDNGTTIPVGGYVGVIVYGGLVFKNMTAEDNVNGNQVLRANNSGLNVNYTGYSYNLADNSNDEAWAAIYVNPLVGRVINGYAVNETETSSAKHTLGRFSISEDGHYHDDDNTERFTLPEKSAAIPSVNAADSDIISLISKVEALEADPTAAQLTDAEKALYSELSLLHTLKNGKKHYSIADINKGEANKLSFGQEVEVDGETVIQNAVPTANADGIINAPNAQALFVLSLITQSGAGTATSANGDYNNSLSYGTYSESGVDTVHGMSHNADYSYVGKDMVDDPETSEIDESKLKPDDYAILAQADTAANTAVPYIIRRFTDASEKTTRLREDKGWTISFDDNGTTKYLTLNSSNLRAETTPYYFDSITKETTPNAKEQWKIQGKANNDTSLTKYLQCRWSNGFAENASWDQGSYIDLYYSDGSLYDGVSIDGNSFLLSNKRSTGNGQTDRYYFIGNINTNATRHLTATKNYTLARPVTFNHVVIDETTTILTTYARCITSTLGYYDINLTAGVKYALPDSYRGLGCVGIYDSAGEANSTPTAATLKTNQFSMKIDTFDGKGCTIDEDIYLNKYKTDNYFNVLHAGATQSTSRDTTLFYGNEKNDNAGLKNNHGIGLFDSVIMKDASSEIGSFTLTGSVNTEIYSNTYSSANQEVIYVDDRDDEGNVYTDDPIIQYSLWLSVGGVCGWSTDGTNANFSNITLNDLTVNGADYVGGLLGISGTSSSTIKVTIKQCSANDISLKMTSAHIIGTSAQGRNAMGAFVGKAHEGAVEIYGTEHDYSTTNGVRNVNDDLTDYSEVKIKSFTFANNSLNYYASVGGLVGYSGHGFRVYDMRVSSSDTAITVGKSDVTYAGGIVGIIQPCSPGNSTGYAEFINCTVENINVAGIAAGGFYGGKWLSTFVPYSMNFNNCKVIGNSNTITGGNYAGGLVGHGTVYTRIGTDSNITISDSTVKGYTITANANKYSGGFIGYCEPQTNSITCYIHDSSVENCVIGQTGNVDYAGGVIGGIKKKNDNKILGYNIKLDNVTSPSNQVGAWIGFVETNDSNTKIQFTGMAIYGSGFSKNIGNWSSENDRANTNATFVYADYSGMSYGKEATAETVSGTTNYILDTKTKTITRTVTDANGKMQLFKYSYSDEPVVTDVIAANSWEMDTGTITRVDTNKQYVYTVELTGNEIFSIDTSTKTITRKIIPVNSGTIRELTYNYTANPTTEAATGAADYWSIDEINGKITHISNGTKKVYTIAVSGLNKGTTVDMPKYPFVNINPQSKLGSAEVLSSDGAVLYDGASISRYSYDDGSGNTLYYPSANTMAAKIYYDIMQTNANAENYTRKYTTFDDADILTGIKIDDYMKRTVDNNGDRISTFKTERPGLVADNVDDFAVVVIANADPGETTALINCYIQLVTNTSSSKNYASNDAYFHVDIKTCKYEDGSFTIDPSQTQSSTAIYIDGNQFKVNQQYVDSKGKNTFTLVDVQFLDPFDTDQIAYHLYVPVYTVREMAINFYAVAKTGAYSASSSTNDYATLINGQATGSEFKHVDSLDTWMTHYIRYEYDPMDIQTLINQGKVRWNYKKTLDFETFTNANDDLPLPGDDANNNDTFVVLVDPNGNSDKAYYAYTSDMIPYSVTNPTTGSTKDCWRIDLERFASDNGSYFEFPSFYDIIKDRIEVDPDSVSGHGQYKLLTLTQAQIDAGEYDIRIGSSYYEFRKDSDGDVDIIVTGTTPIYEDYYLSIKVPTPSNYRSQLYHYSVKPTDLRYYSNAAIQSETGFNKNINSAGLTQKFACSILVANLFEQTTSGKLSVSPPDETITATDKTIIVNASTVITAKNASALMYMNEDEFFQSFYITLARKTSDGVENDIQALYKNNITAKYSIDEPLDLDEESVVYNAGYDCADIDLNSNYINIQTFSKTSEDPSEKTSSYIIDKLKTAGNSVEVYAHIDMEFDDVLYTYEFPKSTNEEGYGVNVRVASNLAYDRSTLAYSSMTEKYTPGDDKYYYIEDSKTATLHYVSKANDTDMYDEIGLNSSNRSTLGVNGLSVDDPDRTNIPDGTGYMPVNTQAYYYIQDIPNASDAQGLKLTFALNRKSNGSYLPIGAMQNGIPQDDIQDYLSGDIKFSLVSGDTVIRSVTSTATGNIVSAEIDISDYDLSSGRVDVIIEFNAKSGATFHKYANYKIDLTATLYEETSCTTPIPQSTAPDSLIYTNAKINPEYITVPESN